LDPSYKKVDEFSVESVFKILLVKFFKPLEKIIQSLEFNTCPRLVKHQSIAEDGGPVDCHAQKYTKERMDGVRPAGSSAKQMRVVGRPVDRSEHRT